MAQFDFFNSISSSILTPGVGYTTLFFDQSNLPNFKDASGNYYNVLVAASGVMRTTGSIVAYGGDLILSSSATMQITVSGTLKVSSSLYASAGPLILSSSVGSVVSFSASEDFTNVDKAYHVRAVNGNLILSSTLGVVALSSSLQLENVNAPFHVRSVNSNLILSSSGPGGSLVYISGNLTVSGSAVGIGETPPAGAALDVSGSNKAVIVPRCQGSASITAVNGMIAYDVNANKLMAYINGGWKYFTAA
jgi:hypothetical protein